MSLAVLSHSINTIGMYVRNYKIYETLNEVEKMRNELYRQLLEGTITPEFIDKINSELNSIQYFTLSEGDPHTKILIITEILSNIKQMLNITPQTDLSALCISNAMYINTILTLNGLAEKDSIILLLDKLKEDALQIPLPPNSALSQRINLIREIVDCEKAISKDLLEDAIECSLKIIQRLKNWKIMRKSEAVSRIIIAAERDLGAVILHILDESDRPMSVSEIHDALDYYDIKADRQDIISRLKTFVSQGRVIVDRDRRPLTYRKNKKVDDLEW